MVKASEVTFGVEIECNFPSTNYRAVGLQNGSYHHGLPVPGFDTWKAADDSSLRANPGYQAVEFVSPILKGKDGLVKLVEFVDWLNENGVIVNDSCGLHVHVGVAGLTDRQINKAVSLFILFERAFYANCGANAGKRFVSGMCAPSQYWTGPTNRYQSLNQKNLARNGGRTNTLEVRCYAATVIAEDIVSAVAMATGLIALASDDEQPVPQGVNYTSTVKAVKDYTAILTLKPDYMMLPDDVPAADYWDTESVEQHGASAEAAIAARR